MPSPRFISHCFKIGLLLLASWGFVSTAGAQALEVPTDLQVPLFLKATTYDRAFESKLQSNGVIHVGIFYQERNRISIQEMEELKTALSRPVAGFKVQVSAIALSDGEDFSHRKEWANLSAVYITSMRGLNLQGLLEQSRKHKVMSVSTDPKLAEKGVSMSFELVGSRPKFVIHRNGALSEGCDFSSQLLKLATIF